MANTTPFILALVMGSIRRVIVFLSTPPPVSDGEDPQGLWGGITEVVPNKVAAICRAFIRREEKKSSEFIKKILALTMRRTR